MQKKFKTSSTSRLFTLGKAVASASASYVYDKVRNTKDNVERIQAATEIIKSMGELKGGWMKLGQMLSITEGAIIPKEITDLFRTLQKDSPSLEFSVVEKLFFEQFQKKPKEVFSYFDETAIAAASIGQVYRARLMSGDWVAVKIQYPNIALAIENDLKSVDKIDMFVGLFMTSKPNLNDLIVELRRCLLEECDYHTEARHTIYFGYQLDPHFPNIKIPKVYSDVSSESILVTEFVEGEPFEDTMVYDQETKDKLGATLYESFMFCFFHLKKIHADPQNGNFLFNSGQMIWLDFGAVRSFDTDFVEDYCMLQYSVEVDDINIYKKAAKNLRVLQDGDTEDFIQTHFDLVKKIYSPYIQPGVYQAQYPNALGMIRDFVTDISWKNRPSPRQELVLLDRNNIGLFMKLKAWNPKVDWVGLRDKWRAPVLESAKRRYGV
ncbi:MAG: AarF/ABC1/UbiB kinase family protein [Bdellovibrionales bacterium]|nr:AarF/ABC1/UbiB kinase family protein [Bdellovibrionales bacterium]